MRVWSPPPKVLPAPVSTDANVLLSDNFILLPKVNYKSDILPITSRFPNEAAFAALTVNVSTNRFLPTYNKTC